MKTFLPLLVVSFLCLNYTFGFALEEMPEKKWQAYKLEHNKNYPDTEDVERFEIFKRTLATIEEHNAKYERGETTYKMGLNHMSDWKDEEKQGILGLRKPPSEQN